MYRIKATATVFLALCFLLSLFGGQVFSAPKIKSSGSDNIINTWIGSDSGWTVIDSVQISTAKRKCFYIVANGTQETMVPATTGCDFGLILDNPDDTPWTSRWSNVPTTSASGRKTFTISTARKIPPGKHTIYFVGSGNSNCIVPRYHLSVIGHFGGNCPKPEQTPLSSPLQGLNAQ